MTPDDSGEIPGHRRVVPHAVRKALEHMRSRLARRITAAELSRAAGVPERTLHRHFVDFLGHPPLVHLRLIRLTAARDALLDCQCGADTSVTEVAARFGLAHLGRFSSEYRRRFGELPSATLARRRPPPAPHGQAAGRQPPSPPIRRQAPTLSLLPLLTEGGTLEERVLAEAVAEQLAAALSRTHALSVRLVRHHTALEKAGANRRDLSGRYSLAGRVARSEDGRMRVVLRLLDLEAGGAHLWGDAFDGSAADLFGLQDRVVAEAARAIRRSVEQAEVERARRLPEHDSTARDLVLRALPFVLAADPASARQALAPLEAAMQLDPDDPAPAALAGWCRAQLVLYQAAPDPVAERARAIRLAEAAAALDLIGDPLALTARSGVLMMALRREEADALLARAQAIDPGFGWAWERSAWVRVNRGATAPALEHFRRAMPLKGSRLPAANCMAGVGTAHYAAGRYDEAASWIRRALAENPRAMWLHRVLAPCYIALGERRAASTAIHRLRDAYPAITVERVMSGLPTFCGDAARKADGPIPDGLAALGLPS